MKTLTVGLHRGLERVELVFQVHKAYFRLHAIISVVSRIALHQVVLPRQEAVVVEQTGNARAGHAAPVVVVAVE